MTIKEAVKGNGYVPGLYSPGIKRAQNLINNNEEIIFACIVNVGIMPSKENLKLDNLKIKNKAAGVFVVTNTKVMFCDSKLDNSTSKQINLENIQSIDDKSSILTGFSKVRVQGNTEMFIIDCNKKMASNIRSALNKALSQKKQVNPTVNNTISEADELRKFKSLLEEGIISQDEFEIKKKQLLNK